MMNIFMKYMIVRNWFKISKRANLFVSIKTNVETIFIESKASLERV